MGKETLGLPAELSPGEQVLLRPLRKTFWENLKWQLVSTGNMGRTWPQPWSPACLPHHAQLSPCPASWASVLALCGTSPLTLAQPDRQRWEHHFLLLPKPRCAGSRDAGPKVHVKIMAMRARSRTSGPGFSRGSAGPQPCLSGKDLSQGSRERLPAAADQGAQPA